MVGCHHSSSRFQHFWHFRNPPYPYICFYLMLCTLRGKNYAVVLCEYKMKGIRWSNFGLKLEIFSYSVLVHERDKISWKTRMESIYTYDYHLYTEIMVRIIYNGTKTLTLIYHCSNVQWTSPRLSSVNILLFLFTTKHGRINISFIENYFQRV